MDTVKAKRSRLRRRPVGVFDVFNVVLFLVLSFIMLYPFWNVVVTSLSTSGEMMKKTFVLWPETFNLRSYEFVLASNRIPRAFWVTVASTLAGTAWCMFLSTTIAYGLSKKYLVGRNAFITFIIVSTFLDGGLIPSYLLISRTLKLSNSFWVLFITGGFNLTTFAMLKAFFNQIPDSLEESARMDGANDIGIFVKIILPLSLPAVATFSLFYAVGLWNQYFGPMIYNNASPQWHTIQLVLRKIIVDNNTKEFAQEMLRKYGTNMTVYEDGMKAAAVIISTAPILIAYPLVQKHFTKGLFLGSVKG